MYIFFKKNKSYMTVFFRIFFLLLLTICFPSVSVAWLYHEHQEIATTAHLEACRKFEAEHDLQALSKIQLTKLDEFCRPVAALCHGHMSAVAADRVISPSVFFNENNENLLKKRNILDCSISDNYASVLTADEIIDKPRDDIELGDEVDLHIRLLLAASNDKHFNPTASDAWKEYFTYAVERSYSGESLEVVLGNHSFALHFLADAFSAGHSGFDRTKRLQNDHRAFHDTYNRVGYFLGANGKKWFTYGDGNLDKNNYYVKYEEFSKEIFVSSLNQIKDIDKISSNDIALVTKTFESNGLTTPLEWQKKKELTYFEQLYDQDPDRKIVLRLALGNPIDIKVRESLDMVILRKADESPDSCHQYVNPSYTLYKCVPHEGKKYVLEAATRSSYMLLMHWLELADVSETTESVSFFVENYWPLDTYLRDTGYYPAIRDRSPGGNGRLLSESPTVFPNASFYNLEKSCYQSKNCDLRHSLYDVHFALEQTMLDDEELMTFNIGLRSAAPFQNDRNIRIEGGLNVFSDEEELDRWYEQVLAGMYVGLYAPKYTENVTSMFGIEVGGLLSFDAGVRAGWGNWFHNKEFAYGAVVVGFDLNFVDFRIFLEYQRKYVNFENDSRYQDNYAHSFLLGAKLVSF